MNCVEMSFYHPSLALAYTSNMPSGLYTQRGVCHQGQVFHNTEMEITGLQRRLLTGAPCETDLFFFRDQ